MSEDKINSLKNEKNKVNRNIVFNVIYQLLVVLTPLITAPYVSRVLGANNLGQFSFAYTIISYFVIFGYLGFEQYAQRAIAEKKGNTKEQSKIFWQIILVRLIPVFISLIVLFSLYAFNVFGEYSPLVLFFSILVGATALDINFFFHGRENFFVVMLLNLLIRLAFLICIFVFVKSTSDLGLYTILYSLMVLGSYLSMWVLLPKNLVKIKLETLNFKKHIKSSLALFIPVAAVSIYAILDKTLIGVLVHGQQYYQIGYITVIANKADIQNGYYYQAERIVRALLSIILAFGTVMTTRNSIAYTSNQIGSVKKNIYHSFRFVFALGVPIALGAIAVAQSFVPLYFGNGYSDVSYLIMAYSPIIIIAGCSNILGMQFLLPTKRDKQYAFSVLIGFLINVVISVCLIPFLGAMGAVIGTLISEFSIALIQYSYVKNEISLLVIFKTIWKYLLAGIIMCVACYILYYFVLNPNRIKNLYDLLILIPTGAAIYYLLLMAFKDKYIFSYSKFYLIKVIGFFKHASNKVIIFPGTFIIHHVDNNDYIESTSSDIVKDKNEEKNDGK